MFDSEGSQMRIGKQFSAAAQPHEEPSEYFPMTLARRGNPCVARAQPLLHLPPRYNHRSRPFVDSGIRDHAHEAQQALPRETHSRGLAQFPIQPGQRRIVA